MKFIRIDRRNVAAGADVVTITLDRPEKKNALNAGMQIELLEAVTDIAGRASDRVLVLTGAGGDFCSGGDLWGAVEDPVPRQPMHGMRRIAALATALHRMPQPVIAKIRGVAVGAGLNMALTCDLVVAADTARLSEIFVKRALVPDFAGTWLLPRRIGMHRAKELAFFGDILSAREAHDIGLVNRVVPEAEIDAFVDDWADRLAAGPPLAMAMAKQLLNGALETSIEEALDNEGAAQTYMFTTRDTREAGIAFVEKRTPTFEGR